MSKIINNNRNALCGRRIYHIWYGMIYRCYNPNFEQRKYYSEKGITVCDEWKKDFQLFYNWAINNGYEDTLTIDRIDNDGNYEPSNCRWATALMQSRNKGISSNNKSGYMGVCSLKGSNKWRAQIRVNNKKIYLGLYESLESAKEAYEQAKIKYWGNN